MSAGSSMLAITLSRPPQRAHCSMSIPNTRFSRRAQLMATCLASGDRCASTPLLCASCPRPAGVIAARSAACGAKTPTPSPFSGCRLRPAQSDRDQPANTARRPRHRRRLGQRRRRSRRGRQACAPPQPSSGAILSVGGEYILATGDEQRGLGKGSDVLETYLVFGKMLPSDSFVQLQGIAELPIDSGFNDELVFRAATGKTMTFGSFLR